MQRLAREWQASSRHQALSQARVNTWVSLAVDAQLRDDPCYMVQGAEVGGLPMVGSADALGVTFMATGQAVVNWQKLVDGVETRYKRIARLPLSMFGRAFAASGYGLSRLLYAAEFVGVPPESVMQRLQSVTAKLVAQGQPPDATGHHFASIAAPALVGHPKVGGCGVMCLEQHIRARHARWAMRLMTQPSTVPWVHVARHILVPAAVQSCPSWGHLLLASCNTATPQSPEAVDHPVGNWHIPAPLHNMVRSLQVLPQWRDVCAGPLPPGDWCYNAPLWCNPFMVGAVHGQLPWRGLEAEHGMLALLGTINTVGDALRACREVHGAVSPDVYQTQVRPFWFGSHPAYQDWQLAKEQLSQLVTAVPAVWRQAAEQVSDVRLPQVPSSQRVVERLVARLGWQGCGNKQYSLQDMTVRQFTLLQWPAAGAAVREKHAAFVQHVCSTQGPGEAPVSVQEVVKCMRAVWQLKWENSRKEVLWRLVFDGFPTAARMHLADEHCACGQAVPGWQHHYWQCPVAQAVVGAIQSQLPAGTAPLQPAHLWVGRLPHEGLHTGVWRVVMLAALLGMDKARQLLAKWRLQARNGQPVPQHVATPAQQLQVACRVAVATLWDMLNDFVSLRLCPAEWLVGVGSEGRVGPNHPFICAGLSGLSLRLP